MGKSKKEEGIRESMEGPCKSQSNDHFNSAESYTWEDEFYGIWIVSQDIIWQLMSFKIFLKFLFSIM